MRPVKLTLNAFGPYRGKTVLDFNDLKENNIYLICGPTGAGKTTIFDAISYALYDEPSGSSRVTKSFRSDFADEKDITYVELEFSIKDKRYFIKRRPEQSYIKVYKNGKKKCLVQKSDVEFFKIGSDKVLTNKAEVLEEIKRVVGLDEKQFRQIVMLPQGEFKKLLEADSKDKEEIFRNVFGTEKFSKVKDELIKREINLKNKINRGIIERNSCVLRINPSDKEELSNLINAEDIDFQEIKKLTEDLIKDDECIYKEAEKDKISLKKEISDSEKNIVISAENNKKLERQDGVFKRITELENKKDDIDNFKKSVQKALKAEKLEIAEKNINDIKYRINEINKKIKKSEEDFNLEKVKKEKAEENLNKASKELEEKTSLIEEKAKLTEEREKLLKYSTINKDMKKTKEETESLKQKLKDLKIEDDKTSKEIEKIDTKIKEFSEKEILKVKTQNTLNQKMEQRNSLATLYKNIKNYEKMCSEKEKYNLEFLEIEKKYKNSKREYENADELFRKSMAGVLADNLKENMPCPVCGSLNHPSPALKLAHAPSEGELKKLKDTYDEKTLSYNKLLSDLAIKESEKNNFFISSIKEVYEAFREKDYLDKEFDENIENLKLYIVNSGKKVKLDVDNINDDLLKIENDINEKNKLQKKCDLLKEKDVSNNEKIEKLNDDFMKKNDSLNVQLGLLKEIENSISSKEMKNDSEFKDKISEIEEKIKKLDLEYKKADELLKNISNKILELKKEIESFNLEIDYNNNKLKSQNDDFNEQLNQSEFESYDDYKKSILNEDLIEKYELEIDSFKKEYSALISERERLKNDIGSYKKADMDLLNENLKKLKDNLDNMENKEREIYMRLNNNKLSLKGAIDQNNKIKDKESEYSVVAELSKLTKGENREKLTFERYVLAAYFEEIVHAANKRFYKMTEGRYTLKRKDDINDKRKQSGLELDVFDEYTGKERHVKTLSGGEGFKASLSLALGLADVIQSHAGGVIIETMFVDEGFGTLDSESLDSAIDVLIDLRNIGRIVGIISHVDELKDRLNARLEVTPSKNGSTAKFIVK